MIPLVQTPKRTPVFHGLTRYHLLNPDVEVNSTFQILYGPRMEYQAEGIWGMVPQWTPSSRFDEVSKARRVIQAEKLMNMPSYSEENGTRRGVIRCENTYFHLHSNRTKTNVRQEYWAPVVFNYYHRKEANDIVLTFSTVTRLVTSYELCMLYPPQLPIELPDPLLWLDPKLSKFKIEPFLYELTHSGK